MRDVRIHRSDRQELLQDTWVVVPAAGRSRRMGRDKATAPLGGTTFLEAVLETIRGLALPAAVVLRREQQEAQRILAHARGRGDRVLAVFNPWPDSHMIDSVALAVREIHRQGSLGAGVLVWPVDCPTVRPKQVRAVLDGAAGTPDRVVAPVWEGATGHPTYFPTALMDPLLSGPLPVPGTLRDLIAPAGPRTVAVDGPEVLANLNTPGDVPPDGDGSAPRTDDRRLERAPGPPSRGRTAHGPSRNRR